MNAASWSLPVSGQRFEQSVIRRIGVCDWANLENGRTKPLLHPVPCYDVSSEDSDEP